jgi:transposase
MNKATTNRFSPEVRSRAVGMVFDHQAEHPSQWAAINSIAGKIGCTGETLRSRVRQTRRGSRPSSCPTRSPAVSFDRSAIRNRGR